MMENFPSITSYVSSSSLANLLVKLSHSASSFAVHVPQIKRLSGRNILHYVLASRDHLHQSEHGIACRKSHGKVKMVGTCLVNMEFSVTVDLYSAGIDFSRQNLTSVDVRF